MKTALVTGANRGIGLAVSRALAAKGHRVLLGCRSPAEGEAAASAFEPGTAIPIALDVASRPSILAAIQRLGRESIEVDALVNNAGILVDGDPFSIDLDDLRRSFEVHVAGPLSLCRALMPGMARRGYGRVVNVSSGWGSFAEGLQGPLAYAVTKAALNALTVKLSQAAGPGVLVNAACPGWVRTRMGGDNAERSPEQAADGIVWLATLDTDGPQGGFFRDRQPVRW